MTYAGIKHMLQQPSVRATAIAVKYSIPRNDRCYIISAESISSCPVVDVMGDGRQTGAVSVIVTIVRNGQVLATMKLEERNFGSARIASSFYRVRIAS